MTLLDLLGVRYPPVQAPAHWVYPADVGIVLLGLIGAAGGLVAGRSGDA